MKFLNKPLNKKFSIIDEGLTIEGAVNDHGNLIVKGIIKGSLDGEIIVITEEGTVLADTRAKNLTISGRFEGHLNVSQKLIIMSKGYCSGEIVCRDLVVETGGILDARISRL